MKETLKNDSIDILDSIGLPPVDYKGPEYNIRALDKYCRSRNTEPSKLTEDELKQFELKPTK